MAHRFCDHLEDYGQLFHAADAAYRACNEELDTVMADGAGRESLDRLVAALENWLERNRLLREALVELVGEGRVRIPKKRTGQVKNRKSAPICAECGFRIPRLTMPEWKVAGNGEVSYRGRELPSNASEAGRGVPSGSEEVGV